MIERHGAGRSSPGAGSRGRRVLRRVGLVAGILAGVLCLLVAAALLVGPPKVPLENIERNVNRSPEQLAAALSRPVAATYPSPLHSQRNGSLCGPASLANALESLRDDTVEMNESDILAGSGVCRTGVCFMGLTLDELAELARHSTDAEVQVLRDLTPLEFKRHLRQSNDPNRRYIVNFHREPIFDAGGGHHSPIGGYDEANDEVLVLDVNDHFGPWLIERERLYEAMDTLDGEKKRGLLLIERP